MEQEHSIQYVLYCYADSTIGPFSQHCW